MQPSCVPSRSGRQPWPTTESNVFAKITTSIVTSKVPSLFATQGTTVHVIEVTNTVTRNAFRIGKTFHDFDDFVKQLQRVLASQEHSPCDNPGCTTLLELTKERMPSRTLISRTPEVARRREENFQSLMDLWFSFINTSRESTCRTALANIPNALIVFLFDGAKMNTLRFWVPRSRSHRGKRIPRGVLKEIMRLAEDERQRAAAAAGHHHVDEASAEVMADNDTVLSVFRSCGSTIHDNDNADEESHEELAIHLQNLRIAIHQVKDLDQLAHIETDVLAMMHQQRSHLLSNAETSHEYSGAQPTP
ncbi:hypothetical protein H310_03860 [Aphanomyces invadans]|uniref:PX domain-containing protein n=1 Tax=Aphanomyces invadans TaxID=157072 RepID=A0A024UEK3_9STRA|nr:hypothetical protein H310_03860 [Aphanomyces invadans]ETW04704.1 hypothetical protein H310_03860 [Aphanomyces invadans]RHY22329.1 hypothetical protein DYB32_009529 [Aphanomyces invadans]|eukprot:XP_008866142.1 hypothetical protein H310_03860 [Aphanomyces invadans]